MAGSFSRIPVKRRKVHGVGMHEALVGWLTGQRTVSLRGANMDRAAFRFHKAIFDATEAHDPDAAEREIEEQLDDVAATFWKIGAAERGSSRG